MKITKTQAFKTQDGQTFPDEGDAINHASLISIRGFFNSAEQDAGAASRLDRSQLVLENLDTCLELLKGVKHQKNLYKRRLDSAKARDGKK